MTSDRIDVLDHGFIRLVESMGSDLSIVRAARVSYDAAWRAGEDKGSDSRLIRDFIETSTRAHSRPWNFSSRSNARSSCSGSAPSPDMELQRAVGALPRIARGLLRARPCGDREQSTDNKQGRQAGEPGLVEQRASEVPAYRRACEEAFAKYRHLLNAGWPRELARSVLPVSTYSHMFAKTNLRNLLHFSTFAVTARSIRNQSVRRRHARPSPCCRAGCDVSLGRREDRVMSCAIFDTALAAINPAAGEGEGGLINSLARPSDRAFVLRTKPLRVLSFGFNLSRNPTETFGYE